MQRSRLAAAVLRGLVQGERAIAAQSSRFHTLRPLVVGLIERLETGEARRQAPWSTLTQRRHFSEELTQQVSDMPEERYHQLADQTLDDLAERIEAYLEQISLADSDVEYSQGVLTIKLGPLGTYVINKQTPNRQIWMSSPVSGPFRYDFVVGHWVYHRDGHQMLTRLKRELTLLTGGEPDLSNCYSCGKLNSCQGELCR